MKCKSTKHFERTGEYLGREYYDTPSSIRGCKCDSCTKMREQHRAALVVRQAAAVRENGKKGGRPKKEEGKMQWLCREHGIVESNPDPKVGSWTRCPHCGDICDKVVGDSIFVYASSTVRKTSDSLAFEKAILR